MAKVLVPNYGYVICEEIDDETSGKTESGIYLTEDTTGNLMTLRVFATSDGVNPQIQAGRCVLVRRHDIVFSRIDGKSRFFVRDHSVIAIAYEPEGEK